MEGVHPQDGQLYLLADTVYNGRFVSYLVFSLSLLFQQNVCQGCAAA